MLKFKKVELVPVTGHLAKQYRDMEPVPNERPLSRNRAKGHCARIMRGQFFTVHWGRCLLGDTWHRGNGNHTSNVIAACLQARNGGLDEKSQHFFDEYLSGRGGEWSGTVQDLPEILPDDFKAEIETFEADRQEDLVEFFKRYDSPQSVRSRSDVIDIYIAEHNDLRVLSRSQVRYALVGTLAAAARNPTAFKLEPDFSFSKMTGIDLGSALRYQGIKDAVQWIVENVSLVDLYKSRPGAQLCAEAYVNWGPETAARIFEVLEQQIDDETEPGSRFYMELTKKRNKPSPSSVVTKGRKTLQQIKKLVRSAT